MCAAVDEIEEKRKPEDFVGHRKRSEYKPIILRCIVRVTHMFESNRGRQKNLVLRNEVFFIHCEGMVYHHALACISSKAACRLCISSHF